MLSDYLFAAAGVTPTDWQTKGVALAGYTVAFLGAQRVGGSPFVTFPLGVLT